MANGIKLLSIIYKFLHIARVFVRLGWKSLPITNTPAYFKNKKFYKIGPCSNGDGDKLRLLLKVGIGLMSMLLFNLQSKETLTLATKNVRFCGLMPFKILVLAQRDSGAQQ